MIIKAYAKINIGLHILGARPDGYHNLETVFHRIKIIDTILLEPAKTLSFWCESTDVPKDASNLCLQAAHLLARESGSNLGAKITLTKQIPVGAGLGGGSSDAASTLLGLNKFWGLKLSLSKLQSIALELGSDVPYFLQTGSALATGRGEVLDYFTMDLPFWILLVSPKIQVSTTWAYSRLSPSERATNSLTKSLLITSVRQTRKFPNPVSNDFEQPIFDQYPEIKHLKESLSNAGAVYASMSGSGSAVYGFYSDPGQVESISSELGSRYRVYLTPPHFQPEQ